MLDFIQNHDTVTFIIAVVSFILSIINFIENRISNRKNLYVVVKYAFVTGGLVFFMLDFINKSRLSISITSGNFVINGTERPLGNKANVFMTYTKPEHHEKPFERPVCFPIKLESLSATELLFQADQPYDEWVELPEKCIGIFGTTRGKVKTRLNLPTNYGDLKQMLQYLK